MKKHINILMIISFLSINTVAAELKVGEAAPLFKAKLHSGADFNLEQQKGRWTILYFFPKSDTPGCTKQACAFRDNIKKITDLGADVYGVSTDSTIDQMAFHKKHGLKFSLISDESGDIVKAYGTKMPMVNISKRWTFVLDDKLNIRKMDKDVDPILDAVKMADFISAHKAESVKQKNK